VERERQRDIMRFEEMKKGRRGGRGRVKIRKSECVRVCESVRERKRVREDWTRETEERHTIV
jgi:hypothetical protein